MFGVLVFNNAFQFFTTGYIKKTNQPKEKAL